jgi:hypothetical protein
VDIFLALLIKPFIVLAFLAVVALGVVAVRKLPEGRVKRLLLTRLWDI